MAEPNHTLQQITEKSKRYKSVPVASMILEILSYLIFVSLIVVAIYLPGFLELKLEVAEEEIGFYILEQEDREFWSSMLRIVLICLSIFPLVIGFLLHSIRRMKKKLREVYTLNSQEYS
jgi:hypothetical protein